MDTTQKTLYLLTYLKELREIANLADMDVTDSIDKTMKEIELLLF